MELLLTAQTNDQIAVTCDGADSHTFDLRSLIPGRHHGNEVVPQRLREQLPGLRTSLLFTSRVTLGWAGEEGLSLGGLTPDEGAQLFRQSAPQRQAEVELKLALELSRLVDGHPLSLRLLGGAFNDSARSLDAFVQEYEAELVRAQDRYKDASHRHRSLYACFEISVRYLDTDLRNLLSGLWVFQAWFLPETVEEIFIGWENREGEKKTRISDESSIVGEDAGQAGSNILTIADQLHMLWRRSLLMRQARTLHDGNVLLYRLLPPMRVYLEQALPQAYASATLLGRFPCSVKDALGVYLICHSLEEQVFRTGSNRLIIETTFGYAHQSGLFFQSQ